jgi:hypothetical protein
MSLIEEVAAQIRAVIADLGQLRTQLDTALHDIERAGQAFAQVGRDTAADQLPQAVTACTEAAERLVAAMSVTDQAREQLWNYLLVITPSLAGPRPTAVPVTASPAALERQDRSPSDMPTTGDSAWGDDDSAHSEPPSHVQRAAAQLPDRRSDDDAHASGQRPEPTYGILTDDDAAGAQVGGPLRSGRGPATGAPGLRPSFGWGVGVNHHVESHTAALMRANRGLRHLTLVINNPPCNPSQPAREQGQVIRRPDGSIQYKAKTCDEQLPAMLPEGAQLTVYVHQDGTIRKWKTYVGTGEGLSTP